MLYCEKCSNNSSPQYYIIIALSNFLKYKQARIQVELSLMILHRLTWKIAMETVIDGKSLLSSLEPRPRLLYSATFKAFRYQKYSIHQDSANLIWLFSEYKSSLKDLFKAIWKIKKGSGSQLSLSKFDKCYTSLLKSVNSIFDTKTQSKRFRFTKSYPIFNQNNTCLLWFSPLHL